MCMEKEKNGLQKHFYFFPFLTLNNIQVPIEIMSNKTNNIQILIIGILYYYCVNI